MKNGSYAKAVCDRMEVVTLDLDQSIVVVEEVLHLDVQKSEGWLLLWPVRIFGGESVQVEKGMPRARCG